MKITCLSLAILSLSFTLSVAAAQSSDSMLTAYYGVKDALIATDVAKAQSQATTLATALKKMPTTEMSVADKNALATAKTQAVALSKTTDVEAQREAFEVLSASVITLAKAAQPAKRRARTGGPAPTYVQFCPMAAEGKGASWLSDSREIRNPYYGSKMLKCGSVKEEI